MSEHREALSKIMEICAFASTYTRRTQQIHEVAMIALGLTANQRHARHVATLERIGNKPLTDAYLLRAERRAERLAQLAESEVPA